MDSAVSLNTQAPFLGFMVGSILFGGTLLQTYHYFLHYGKDSRTRKLIILIVCILDCMHFSFSAIMMCFAFTSTMRFANPNVIWSLKGLSTTDALLLVFVQSFYLHLIWVLAENMAVAKKVSQAIKAFSAFTFAYALGIGSVLLVYMVQLSQVFHFSVSFKQVVCIAIGSTAAIDTLIAITMTGVLYKMIPPSPARRGIHTVHQLVIFFVSSGMLTAVCAVIRLALFASNPSSTTYLALHFAVPRLYVNSILALFNSKSRLKENLDSSEDFRLSSGILFGDFTQD